MGRGMSIAPNTYFKQLIRSCSSKTGNKYFEISLKAFKKNMKNTIFTVNFIGSIIGYKNFIFSTSAFKPLQCKMPKDLLNIINLFDPKIKSAKVQNCISKNIEGVLENSKMHRIAFKESIESHSLQNNAQCPNKAILEKMESSENTETKKKKD